MFKNIQKYLLLNYPLLWNTKFIPMVIIGILLNIVSFIFGYLDGKIDFSTNEKPEIQFIYTAFCVLVVLVTIVLWLFSYFKNNAFKSFYSNKKYSLFNEWIQIFVILIVLVFFSVPFEIGKHLRQRNYLSEQEATKRCEIISKANVFIDGHFGYVDNKNDSDGRDNDISKDNYIIFEGKKYNQYSLVNRQVYEFSLISLNKNLSNKISIQKDLVNDNKIGIKNLMNDYLKIVDEHKLATNLTTDIWFSSVYKNYPTFVDYLFIKPYFDEVEKYYGQNKGVEYPTNYSTGNYDSKYSKYYVQQDILKENYDLVSNSFTNNLVDKNLILSLLYVAFGLSLAIFSFRVTSGKNWLIAVVTLGILNIVFGVFSVIASITAITSILYPFLCLLAIFAFCIYFFWKYLKFKDKGKSSIALNILLWTFAMFIPIVYLTIMNYINFYNNYSTTGSEKYTWMENNTFNMFLINFIISIIIMFFLSGLIRKWKGIAED